MSLLDWKKGCYKWVENERTGKQCGWWGCTNKATTTQVGCKANCGVVHYCSESCQRKDYENGHKEVCELYKSCKEVFEEKPSDLCPICYDTFDTCDQQPAFVHCINDHTGVCHDCHTKWFAPNQSASSQVSRIGIPLDTRCAVCNENCVLQDIQQTLNVMSAQEVKNKFIVVSEGKSGGDNEDALSALISFVQTAERYVDKTPDTYARNWVLSDCMAQAIFLLADCDANTLFHRVHNSDAGDKRDLYAWNSKTATRYLCYWMCVIASCVGLDHKKIVRIALSWFTVWATSVLNTVHIKIECAVTKKSTSVRAPRTLSPRYVYTYIKKIQLAENFERIETCADIIAIDNAVYYDYNHSCLAPLCDGNCLRTDFKSAFKASMAKNIKFLRVPHASHCVDTPSFLQPHCLYTIKYSFVSNDATTPRKGMTFCKMPMLSWRAPTHFGFKEHLKAATKLVFDNVINTFKRGDTEFWQLYRKNVQATAVSPKGETVPEFENVTLHEQQLLHFVVPNTVVRSQFLIDEFGTVYSHTTHVDTAVPRIDVQTKFSGSESEFKFAVIHYLCQCAMQCSQIEDKNARVFDKLVERIFEETDAQLGYQKSQLVFDKRGFAEMRRVQQLQHISENIPKLDLFCKYSHQHVADIWDMCKAFTNEHRSSGYAVFNVKVMMCRASHHTVPMFICGPLHHKTPPMYLCV